MRFIHTQKFAADGVAHVQSDLFDTTTGLVYFLLWNRPVGGDPGIGLQVSKNAHESDIYELEDRAAINFWRSLAGLAQLAGQEMTAVWQEIEAAEKELREWRGRV